MSKPVFPILSIGRLAGLLGLTKPRLVELAKQAPELYGHAELIVPFKIARPIRVPSSRLATVQRRILERVLIDFVPHECSFGGVKGKTSLANAQSHWENSFKLKIDIRKFYPNVHHRWVQALFERRLGCSPPVANILRRLLTLDRGLPQGTCTSPALADQILRPFDVRMRSALGRRAIEYTRWIDDITLSADFSMRTYVPFIDRILRQYGLRIHNTGDKAPTQFGPGEVAIVTGLALRESEVSVPAEYIEKIRRELRMAWRFAEGHSTESPPYGMESYWGTIRYIGRFKKRSARDLTYLFDRIDWQKLSPLGLGGKRGKLVFISK